MTMTPTVPTTSRRRPVSVVLVGLLLASPAFGAHQARDLCRLEPGRPVYTLGIVPFLPPERLELTFGHMAKRFGETLGCDVHFRTSTTFERYVENVLAEDYDFAQVPPFLFVRLDPGSYVPLARPPGSVTNEFVVLEGSRFERLLDLSGEAIAVHPTRNEVVEYVTESALLEAGLKPGEDVHIRYFGSPLSCLQQVLVGMASACVTTSFTREPFEEQMGVRFRTIGHTVPVPFGPFVAHERVPPEEREAIREILMTWREDPRNTPPRPASGAQVPSFVPVTPGDYDSVLQILKRVRDR